MYQIIWEEVVRCGYCLYMFLDWWTWNKILLICDLEWKWFYLIVNCEQIIASSCSSSNTGGCSLSQSFIRIIIAYNKSVDVFALCKGFLILSKGLVFDFFVLTHMRSGRNDGLKFVNNYKLQGLSCCLYTITFNTRIIYLKLNLIYLLSIFPHHYVVFKKIRL